MTTQFTGRTALTGVLTRSLQALPPIRRATRADIEELARLAAAAFAPLPSSVWLVPEVARRKAMLAAQFRLLIGHALYHGMVEQLADGTAMAVWFDHTMPVPPPADYPRRLQQGCGSYAWRFRTLDDLLGRARAVVTPGPHHYLALLAVRPDRQGTGRGTALLTHRDLDAFGVPVHLEAPTRRLRDWFTRHGYRPEDPVRLPDGARIWPMNRQPQRPTGPD